MSGRRLHLNVNLLHSGGYPSAWRLPESERGRLDALFLADTPGPRPGPARLSA